MGGTELTPAVDVTQRLLQLPRSDRELRPRRSSASVCRWEVLRLPGSFTSVPRVCLTHRASVPSRPGGEGGSLVA